MTPVVTKNNQQKKNKQKGLEIVLIAIAALVTISIFLKAIIDIDTNYDTWWYHLPFAARIWGIIPREMFIGDEKWFEPRFDGFPLLAHFLQGFFWKITGRIQSTNLVGFLSIVGYFFFLKAYFKVPLYLSAIALLAIPLVSTHVTTGFVDLFGNVGVSILVMMTYSFYKNKQLPQKQELFVAFIGAAIAANTKTQLQPLVFVILIVASLRLGWLYWQQKSPAKQLLKIVPVALLATVIIFATPVKNTILYANPFYPIKVEVGGIVLNHKLSPEAYEEGNRQQNWLESVLEINATLHWTADQWSPDITRIHRGGFFGAYVIFNVLLLSGLSLYEFIQNRQLPPAEGSRDARTALVTVLIMSLIPANFPQSHELRYFMFWMITLVSLNLYLLSRSQINWQRWRWLQPQYMGLVYLVFLTIVVSKIGSFYGRPVFISLEQRLSSGVKPELLSQIKPEDNICLIIKPTLANRKKIPFESKQNAFLYSSYFHPELNYSYSIKAEVDPENCGDLKILPGNGSSEL